MVFERQWGVVCSLGSFHVGKEVWNFLRGSGRRVSDGRVSRGMVLFHFGRDRVNGICCVDKKYSHAFYL